MRLTQSKHIGLTLIIKENSQKYGRLWQPMILPFANVPQILAE